MKSANEFMRENRAFTLITCNDCGSETSVPGHMTSQKAQQAIERNCRACNPVVRQGGTNSWSEFGLKKNPYVYGPMPHKRTSERWRLEEARKMGWLAWHWVDEYTEVRMKLT